MSKLIPLEVIEKRIYLIRGKKVMLDFDLADLYGVENKYLKRQVRRNRRRFPSDFMFQLTKEENLRCQNVTSSYGGLEMRVSRNRMTVYSLIFSPCTILFKTRPESSLG
jgi:hypothetical protein